MRYYSEATVNEMLLYFARSRYFPIFSPYPSIQIPESPWHTGTPTEEGWYLITDGQGNYDVTYWFIAHVEDEEDNEGGMGLYLFR